MRGQLSNCKSVISGLWLRQNFCRTCRCTSAGTPPRQPYVDRGSVHKLRILISEGLIQADSEFYGVEFPGPLRISQKFALRDSWFAFADWPCPLWGGLSIRCDLYSLCLGCGRFSKVRIFNSIPDPGALNSRTPTFPEKHVGLSMVWHIILEDGFRGQLRTAWLQGRQVGTGNLASRELFMHIIFVQ